MMMFMFMMMMITIDNNDDDDILLYGCYKHLSFSFIITDWRNLICNLPNSPYTRKFEVTINLRNTFTKL